MIIMESIMQFKHNIAFSGFKAVFLNYEQLQIKVVQKLNLSERKIDAY